ncbi:methylated-DNA--[protein]-cysteine S-methyltransferase [Cryobacterium glaciale]|uniref:Methylated-DNA--protein-cysteine methyltransferase n=1 Tax=Cryobacterium glaciale TaxID=1259145 RepID=A0A4R8UY03_9MICO|nr:methylated-DNA--[protein]-cysteine S-methyltransferase [Cryobacterium glaciale]TFB72686.1 methylated-DNA--[protein]-cysteine S-methyltransferase [Cryobacterium glaciale]
MDSIHTQPSRSTTPNALLRLPSPIGRLELTADDEGVLSLSIETDGRLPLEATPETPSPVLRRAAEQLDEYFAGTRQSFDLPVHLTRGTEFQRSVWARLATLNFGDVISYGALGSAIGRTGSGRAIGGAVGANPVPIIIGCHRVLASSGQITGYSAGQGIPTKAWLLDHEGILHR